MRKKNSKVGQIVVVIYENLDSPWMAKVVKVTKRYLDEDNCMDKDQCPGDRVGDLVKVKPINALKIGHSVSEAYDESFLMTVSGWLKGAHARHDKYLEGIKDTYGKYKK